MAVPKRKMISRKQFQKMNEARWQESERVIERLDAKGDLSPQEARELPASFRKVCRTLASQEKGCMDWLFLAVSTAW